MKVVDNLPFQKCGPTRIDILEILPFKIWVRTTPSFVLYVAYCTRCWLLWEPLGMPPSCQLMVLSSIGERKNVLKFGDFPLWQYLGLFDLNTNYTNRSCLNPGAFVPSRGHPVNLVCGYGSPSFLKLDCSFDWLFFFFFFFFCPCKYVGYFIALCRLWNLGGLLFLLLVLLES